MIINTAEECGGRVLAVVLHQEVATARMLVLEVGNVVNKAGNHDEGALLSLLKVALPADDGQVVAVRRP